jgi:hypothetical protein
MHQVFLPLSPDARSVGLSKSSLLETGCQIAPFVSPLPAGLSVRQPDVFNVWRRKRTGLPNILTWYKWGAAVLRPYFLYFLYFSYFFYCP